jgi:hypothetical protein
VRADGIWVGFNVKNINKTVGYEWCGMGLVLPRSLRELGEALFLI